MTVTFEGYERRADKINKCLADNGIASLEEALELCPVSAIPTPLHPMNTTSIAVAILLARIPGCCNRYLTA